MSQENINGGAALDALLASLPVKMETNVMRSALRAGAAVYLAQVKQNIPVLDGVLQRSARITTRKSKTGQVSASVKVGGENKKTGESAFYAHMVEFGTRPHVIAPRAGGLQINGQFVGGAVEHPGSRPRPFMRPAADAQFSAAVAAVQKKVRDRLRAQGLDVPDPPLPGEGEA